MPISVAAVACALVLGAQTARANVIYEYTGDVFTIFSNPYSAIDYIHGSFTAASALAPNLVQADLSAAILSFVFNDFADDHAPSPARLRAGSTSRRRSAPTGRATSRSGAWASRMAFRRTSCPASASTA